MELGRDSDTGGQVILGLIFSFFFIAFVSPYFVRKVLSGVLIAFINFFVFIIFPFIFQFLFYSSECILLSNFGIFPFRSSML